MLILSLLSSVSDGQVYSRLVKRVCKARQGGGRYLRNGLLNAGMHTDWKEVRLLGYRIDFTDVVQ